MSNEVQDHWGFQASRPGGNGSGVMTTKVLEKKPKAVAKAPKAPAPDISQEQEFSKENLLFLKAWLEASLKDVDEALAKL